MRALVDRWRSLNPCAFFDEDSIEPGGDGVGAIERGIEGSRHVVFVITPASVASRRVAMETALTIFGDPDARDRRLMPVMLETTPPEVIRLSVRPRNRIDLTDSATRQARYHYLLGFLKVPERPPLPVIPGSKGDGTSVGTGTTEVSMSSSDGDGHGEGGDRCSAVVTQVTTAKCPIESIIDSHEGVFWVGADGGVSSTRRDDNVDKGAWHPPFAIAPPDSARAGPPLVAISRR